MKDLLFDLQRFAFVDGVTAGSHEVNPVNVSTQSGMSPTMKTFYDTTLLENARENMVFEQFAMKQPMKGNKVEWRKFNTFDKALTPLTEGVIPTGKTFGMTKIEATISQHGDYVSVSDRLEMESYDDVIFGATEEMGAAESETYDTLTRNIIYAGNSVAYAGTNTKRSTVKNTDTLTPALISKAVTWLKKNKAPLIDGSYVCIIHPSVSEDLRNSAEWLEAHKYADPAPIFKGEIGMLHKMRFVESNASQIFRGADLASDARTLKVTNASGNTITFNGCTVEASALVGRKILVGTSVFEVTANTASTITTKESVGTISASTVIYPGEGGAEGVAVYGSLCLGKDAYGILEPSGETMEMIIKPKEVVGGPLNQFSTIGYKFCHGAKILYQERMLRLETGSSYGSTDEEN